jgi:hypothetical protein
MRDAAAAVDDVEGHAGPQEKGIWISDPLIMDERYVAVRIKGGL